MRVEGVILALGNMTYHSAINSTIALYSSPYFYSVSEMTSTVSNGTLNSTIPYLYNYCWAITSHFSR